MSLAQAEQSDGRLPAGCDTRVAEGVPHDVKTVPSCRTVGLLDWSGLLPAVVLRESHLCVRTCEHQPGRLFVTARTVRAPDGLCLPGEEPAAWSSVCPTSSNHEPHNSQAFLVMHLKSRVFRSTGEIEGGGVTSIKLAVLLMAVKGSGVWSIVSDVGLEIR